MIINPIKDTEILLQPPYFLIQVYFIDFCNPPTSSIQNIELLNNPFISYNIDYIGKTTNILRGIKIPLSGAGSNKMNQFLSPETSNLVTVNGNVKTEESAEPEFGPFIQLTFHRKISSLLQEFYSGLVQFGDDSFKAGGLVMQPGFAEDTNAQAELAGVLGIRQQDLTDPTKSFVLARYWKTVRTHTARSVSFNDNYNIENFRSIDRSQPDDIIPMFSQHGTHYVSGYSEGDFIHQVFVYGNSIFDQIQPAFPDESLYRWGWKGYYFRAFTKPRVILPDGGITGYCDYVGDILAASGDQAFGQIEQYMIDDTYGIKSIFTFLTKYSLALKADKMKTVIPIKSVLNSLSSIVYSGNENDSQKAWNDVLNGAVYQLYGSVSSPEFDSVDQQVSLSFYKYFNPDLVTQTATTYTSIVQAKFDLTELKINNPAFINELFIFADILELPANATVKLPGTTKIYLVCREFISHSGTSVPEIKVGSQDSSPEVIVIASSFKGVMRLSFETQTPSHVTYLGGPVLKTVRNNDGTYTVVSEHSKEIKYPLPSVVPNLYAELDSGAYESTWLANSFLNGMELLAMTIETVYSLQIGETTKIAQESLNWLISMLIAAGNETVLTGDVEVVLSRALLLQRMNPNPRGLWLIVPKLRFEHYMELYESLLTSVQLYEQQLTTISTNVMLQMQSETIVNSQQELNTNVLKIGKFLVNKVEADAQYFNDVDNMFARIVSKKEQDISDEETKSAELYAEIIDYIENVTTAGKELNQKVKEYGRRQVFQLITGIVLAVGDMFTGGVNLGMIEDTITGIARIAKKIEYITQIATQISTIYKSIRPLRFNAAKINKKLVNLPDMSQYSKYFPTAMDWSDFDAEIAQYTAYGYLGCCAHKAAAFKAVATKLSSRAKAYLESLEKISLLQYDMVVNRMQSEVAGKQSDRLGQLKSTLQQQSLADYQTNSINLFELGNILQNKANTIRMQLARTYLTMDAALQYETLKQPTPLSGYNTLSIQSAAAQQISDSINALETVSPQPTDLANPVVFEIPDVRISDLTSEKGFRYTIPIAAPEFEDYVRLRIREIRVTINSIESAGTDEINIRSIFSGAYFKDRGLQRESRTFNTFSKEYPYVYNYKTGETVISNRATYTSDKYIMMTPFGEWIFSIPQLKNYNVDIQYSSQMTTLRIEFYLNVVFSPLEAGRTKRATGPCFMSATSEECLLYSIVDRTVAADWDAVMVMDASRINDLWEKKYQNQDHGGLAYNISTDWTPVSGSIEARFFTKERIVGIVGPPRISFILNNPSQLKIKMTMSNIVITTRNYYKGNLDEELIEPKNSNTTITCFNDITKIIGSVDSSMHTVAVDMSTSLINLNITGITTRENALLGASVEELFRKLASESYDLGTIDFNSALTPTSLQPRQFLFTTGGVNSTSKLLICILTGATRTNRVSEPTVCEITGISKDTGAVIPSGYTAALYVSSELIFEDIMLPEFRREI